MSNVEDLERMRKFGAYEERQRILRLLSDQLVPEILNRINPVVDYNKFIGLLIHLVDEAGQADEYGNCDTCNVLYDLSSTQGRCGDCGECAEHCDHVPAAGVN
jgi:hypothetical protein